MKTCILNIGDEIVDGSVVNTNAAFLAKILSENGFSVSSHLCLRDREVFFPEFLTQLYNISDVVIITGGLGPTCDDVTRSTLASFFKCGFCYNEEVAEDIKKRFGNLEVSARDQATLPEKAIALLNPLGTAPALVFEEENKCVIALPGVPQEMQALFEDKVLPFLAKKYAKLKKPFVKKVHFCLLFESLLDPIIREIIQVRPALEVGIYPSYGILAVLLKSYDLADIDFAFKTLKEKYATYFFESPSGKISEALHNLLINRKETLAFAESCTGGALAKEMTFWPSASSYFLGSFVAYSNQLKSSVLNVSEETLKRYGAVSQQTVEELANGALAKTSASWAVSVSGIAGPGGGTEEKPVGTIWVAIASKEGNTFTFKLLINGTRETIILKASNHILARFYRLLQYGIKPDTP